MREYTCEALTIPEFYAGTRTPAVAVVHINGEVDVPELWMIDRQDRPIEPSRLL
jgi:hypothetical protein